jgi:NADPH:quinone reductase-like Zn-dependent oxidoreductase
MARRPRASWRIYAGLLADPRRMLSVKHDDPFDRPLTGQTALVTGCKRGIGLAICKTLAEAGADIIGVSASLETARK